MTKKRFTINGKEIIQDKQVWCVANSEHCADIIATAMNDYEQTCSHYEKRIMKLKDKIYDYEQICSYYEKRIMKLKDEISELKGETRVIVGDLE